MIHSELIVDNPNIVGYDEVNQRKEVKQWTHE